MTNKYNPAGYELTFGGKVVKGIRNRPKDDGTEDVFAQYVDPPPKYNELCERERALLLLDDDYAAKFVHDKFGVQESPHVAMRLIQNGYPKELAIRLLNLYIRDKSVAGVFSLQVAKVAYEKAEAKLVDKAD